RYARDVPDGEGQAVAGLERHVLEILGRVDETYSANRELLIAVTKEPAADVNVRLLDRLLEVRERDAGRAEAVGVDLDVDLFQVAAERQHVRDALDLAQHTRDVPLHL